MVRVWHRPSPLRPGFTLIEAIIALLILVLGLLGAAAVQSLASHLLDDAEGRARAVTLAGGILDSLLTVPHPISGELVEGRYRASWRVGPAEPGRVIELEVEYDVATATRRLQLELLHLPPLPRIGGATQPELDDQYDE